MPSSSAGLFLCNDSRLTECGKTKMKCWNWPYFILTHLSLFIVYLVNKWFIKCERFWDILIFPFSKRKGYIIFLSVFRILPLCDELSCRVLSTGYVSVFFMSNACQHICVCYITIILSSAYPKTRRTQTWGCKFQFTPDRWLMTCWMLRG